MQNIESLLCRIIIYIFLKSVPYLVYFYVVFLQVCDAYLSPEALSKAESSRRSSSPSLPTSSSPRSISLAQRYHTAAQGRLRGQNDNNNWPHRRLEQSEVIIEEIGINFSRTEIHSEADRHTMHRQLRLRRISPAGSEPMGGLYGTLQFSRKLAAESIVSRLSMLGSALGTCPSRRVQSAPGSGGLSSAHSPYCDAKDIRGSRLTPRNLRRMLDLDSRVAKFGYRLLCPSDSFQEISRHIQAGGAGANRVGGGSRPAESLEAMCYLSYRTDPIADGSSGSGRGSSGGKRVAEDESLAIDRTRILHQEDALAPWLL